MDPNLLKNIDLFADPNAQTGVPGNQNAESSASGAAQAANTTSTSIWDPSGAFVEPGVSDEFTMGGGAFAQPTSIAPANLTFGSVAEPSPYSGGKTTLPARTNQATAATRTREGHQRKRAKVDSDAPALDSVDYWIHFDDDEVDKGGSFEIDFSKLQNASNHTRPINSMNTMSSMPGLGTGLYSSTSSSNPRGETMVDDSALDNALSEEENEDGFDSINLTDHLSKIDSLPPTDVPPREGLYSTPLSWEKPQPGLRAADPLLGATPSTGHGGLLNDVEQRKLLAIAMNTGRPQQQTYPSGFGGGFGFGYPGLTGGFPTLGADNLMDTTGFGTTNLSQVSKSPEKRKAPPPSQQEQSQQAHQNQQARTQGQPQNQKSTRPATQPPSNAKLEGKAKEPQQKPQLQRTATDLPDAKHKDKGKPGDRTAHNDIERKYRTNLKDKISELRDAVPALRAIPEEGGEEDADAAEEGGASGSQRAPKVSKGTVLTKATEYIHFLERRNKNIMREHQELSRRLQAFEQLLNATAQQPFPVPSYSRTLFDPRGFC